MSRGVREALSVMEANSGVYAKTLTLPCTQITRDARVRCPTGLVKVVACVNGMHELTLEQPAKQIDGKAGCEEINPGHPTSDKVLSKCLQWLEHFFNGNHLALPAVKPPLCPAIFNHETFRSKVWCTLESEVLFGSRVSYGELAKLCGSPKASQAVGSAMRNNPLSLIVPCHRVILSSGKIGNYAGGKMNDTKAWLLEYEALSCANEDAKF